MTGAVTINIDDLEFGADVDFVRSGSGADTITAGDAAVLIMGGGGGDTIDGSTSGLNLLFGNAGNDTITGHGGTDIIAGGDGDDTIVGQGMLIGDSFTFDTLNGLSFSGIASGNFQASLQMVGTDSGDDTITGGSGFDLIVGGDGNDKLAGGDGLNVAFGDSFNLKLSVGLDFNEIFSPSIFASILSPAFFDL